METPLWAGTSLDEHQGAYDTGHKGNSWCVVRLSSSRNGCRSCGGRRGRSRVLGDSDVSWHADNGSVGAVDCLDGSLAGDSDVLGHGVFFGLGDVLDVDLGLNLAVLGDLDQDRSGALHLDELGAIVRDGLDLALFGDDLCDGAQASQGLVLHIDGSQGCVLALDGLVRRGVDLSGENLGDGVDLGLHFACLGDNLGSGAEACVGRVLNLGGCLGSIWALDGLVDDSWHEGLDELGGCVGNGAYLTSDGGQLGDGAEAGDCRIRNICGSDGGIGGLNGLVVGNGHLSLDVLGLGVGNYLGLARDGLGFCDGILLGDGRVYDVRGRVGGIGLLNCLVVGNRYLGLDVLGLGVGDCLLLARNGCHRCDRILLGNCGVLVISSSNESIRTLLRLVDHNRHSCGDELGRRVGDGPLLAGNGSDLGDWAEAGNGGILNICGSASDLRARNALVDRRGHLGDDVAS